MYENAHTTSHLKNFTDRHGVCTECDTGAATETKYLPDYTKKQRLSGIRALHQILFVPVRIQESTEPFEQ
jgi:hypothetical protein